MQLLIQEIPYQDPMLLVATIPFEKNFVFFDSVAQYTHASRYSFIAYDPFSIITYDDDGLKIDGILSLNDPLEYLTYLLNEFAFKENFPLPFMGGFAGFFSYEFASCIENKVALEKRNYQMFPKLALGIFDVVIGYDHVLKKSWICSSGLPEQTINLRKKRAHLRYLEALSLLKISLKKPLESSVSGITLQAIKSNLAFGEYCERIEKVLAYIQAGDIYQANIAQRFDCQVPADFSPVAIYNKLRTLNKAPFAAFVKIQDSILASASPERFVSLNNGLIITSPIKGTSGRSSNPIIDKRLAEQLYCCEKNRAENLMIVDLMRNDLARVCKLHSVNVKKLFSLESYSTVHHLVSTITGQLRSQLNAIDLLKAAFPGGSITGAPKMRAMEIIEEIEPDGRGPYCGAIGYLGFNGTMDTSIVIRTLALKENKLSFHVGGGIVADSIPEEEHAETLIKAKGLFNALTGEENFSLEAI